MMCQEVKTMRIYCPKCRMGYEVEASLIPEEGRRLRCGNCGEIFRFDRSGMSRSESAPAEPRPEKPAEQPQPEESALEESVIAEEEADTQEAEEPKVAESAEINMKDVFARLSEQSEKLFEAEQKLSAKDRLLLRIKTMLGLYRKFNFKLIGAATALLVLALLYNYRYEIVRTLPFANGVYRAFGIRAKIPGEGLEFQNINWNYIESNGGKVLEVKGFINNPTSRKVEVPMVHVELLDKDTVLLQSINQKPSLPALKPDSRIAIGVIIKTPSPTAKYVFLTFIDAE